MVVVSGQAKWSKFSIPPPTISLWTELNTLRMLLWFLFSLLPLQVHQERLYQEYTYSKAEGHLKQMEKVYTQQLHSKDAELTSMKSEVSSLKKVLEEYKKKFTELSEKLMERNRQYQKLQGLYDSLRLRNIAVASQEADHDPPMMPQPAVFGFPLGKDDGFSAGEMTCSSIFRCKV